MAIQPQMKTSLDAIKTKLQTLDEQAQAHQNVKSGDLDPVLKDLQQLQATDSLDSATSASLARLVGDVQNLQGIADSDKHNTAATNSSWTSMMKDASGLADSMINDKTDTFKAEHLGAKVDDAARKAAGNDLAKVDAKNQVYSLNTDPATYVEDNADTKQYSVYDASGKMTSQFNYDQAGKFALDMGTGQVMALSTKGFEHSWLINGTADRKVLGNGHEGSMNVPASGNAEGSGTGFKEGQTLAQAKAPDKANSKYHSWLGTNSADGKTVYADVWSNYQEDKPSARHIVKLKNEAGEVITPADMANGEYGAMNMTNGSKFVSNPFGYWMINGAEARNVATGQVAKAETVMDDLNKSGVGFKTYDQGTIETENAAKKEKEKQAIDDSLANPAVS